MSLASSPSASPAQRLATRLLDLQDRHGFTVLDGASFPAFAGMPGTTLIMFAEDPAKVPETWDLTIILPEMVAASIALGTLRVGVLPPEAARPLAARYGIRLWPALLALRDGDYLGTIEGLKDWPAYCRLIPELLAAPAARPPGIGIPLRDANATTACH